MQIETPKSLKVFVLIPVLFFFSFALAQDTTGTQRFQIRTESKSFEKTKFRNLAEARAAVAKFRRSYNSRIRDLDKRCGNHFGPGYKFNGLSIKERAIGYMNEDLPVEKFQWKRLIADVFIQCLKSP